MQISKPQKRAIIKKLVFVIICVSLGWYLKSKTINPGAMGAMGAQTPYVLVKQANEKDTTKVKSHIAHVEAINAVDLMPKVNGTIKEVLFEEKVSISGEEYQIGYTKEYVKVGIKSDIDYTGTIKKVKIKEDIGEILLAQI